MKMLNSDGINNLGIMGYMTTVFRDMRTRVSKGDWSSDTKRAISLAATWADKAYLSVCSELTVKQGILLANRLNSWKGANFDIIKPSISSIEHIETVEIVKDDWLDIIEHTLNGGCQNCIGMTDCHMQDIFLKYDVPAVKENEKCLYLNSKKGV